MSLIVNTNVQSINAQRMLSKSSKALGTTYSRLASGLRVNSAKDDTAGLTIGTRLSAQIRGINQAGRNANDAISLTQVAEGSLEETENALQRIRELVVQASNDTYTTTDRTAISNEMTQMIAEVDRIAQQTQYNGQNLLTGSYSGKQFQIGAYSGQTATLSVLAFSKGALSLTLISGLTGSQLSATATASALTLLDTAINSVSDMRAKLGAFQNRFEAVVNNLANMSENISASRSRIMDADIAQETASLTRNSILQQAGTAILAQANQQPQLALQLLG